MAHIPDGPPQGHTMIDRLIACLWWLSFLGGVGAGVAAGVVLALWLALSPLPGLLLIAACWLAGNAAGWTVAARADAAMTRRIRAAPQTHTRRPSHRVGTVTPCIPALAGHRVDPIAGTGMPLKARLDGRDLIAPFLGDAEWAAVAAATRGGAALTLPCCGAAGGIRRSRLGRRFFYHRTTRQVPRCAWAGETAAHLLAKATIALACWRAGYSVTTEARGPGGRWVADVLATPPDRGAPLAFEVQWSDQTLDATLARQAAYAADGVRGCWFFRRPPGAGRRPTAPCPCSHWRSTPTTARSSPLPSFSRPGAAARSNQYLAARRLRGRAPRPPHPLPHPHHGPGPARGADCLLPAPLPRLRA